MKEQILLDVLIEHGEFQNVREQFNSMDLACIMEAMERYRGQNLPLHNVSYYVAQQYAEFCVRCDKEKLPLIKIEDYLKQL